MKKRGLFRRLLDRFFRRPPKTQQVKQPQSKEFKLPERELSKVPVQESTYGDYELSGWRLEGDKWNDVEKDSAPLPRPSQWESIDLVTLNLDPHGKGFYRSARVLGFDYFKGSPRYNWTFTEAEPGYTLDDLAAELAHEYGFIVQ
jgi:hypothetical protein